MTPEGMVFPEPHSVTILRHNLETYDNAFLQEAWDLFWQVYAGFWNYQSIYLLTWGDYAEILFGVMCARGM